MRSTNSHQTERPMKKLLRFLAEWKLPDNLWAWSEVLSKARKTAVLTQLDMGESFVQGPKGDWTKTRAGVLIAGKIEFVNMHPDAPQQFLEMVALIPEMRRTLLDMRAQIAVAATLLDEVDSGEKLMTANWTKARENFLEFHENVQADADEERSSPLAPPTPSRIVLA